MVLKLWLWMTYRAEALGQLMAMTLLLGDEAKGLKTDPGIKSALKYNFEKGTPPAVAATYLAATFMSHAIEQESDIERLIAVEQGLTEWAKLDVAEQRSVVQKLMAGNIDHNDMLLTRCQWLLVQGQTLLLEGKITTHDFRMLKDAIWGPLKGDTADFRLQARLRESFESD